MVLSVDGRDVAYRVEAIIDPTGHDRIRALLRDKYGLRDWWVGKLVDTYLCGPVNCYLLRLALDVNLQLFATIRAVFRDILVLYKAWSCLF